MTNNAPESTALPWSEMIAFALGTLRIPPETFWNMSVKEWRLIILSWHNKATQKILTKSELSTLMMQFPDPQKTMSTSHE